MSKCYIPIIGTISAGKSTFLKAFLGIDVLETGATTTTKFICLIKNSNQTSFYHVIPNTNNGVSFNKEGNEIKNIKQIKKKIEEINQNLSEKKGTQNEIFYMLETPIKNINNVPLLEKCIFMDIPGLNENDTNYIENIFSLINMNYILFEIMIFDSTSIGSDAILKIFQKLNDKGCLKKEDNLYILNKIDQITQGGEENIIDIFKKYFYDNFEDEKKTDDPSRIEINFSKNHFIPMNSLLYQAETKYEEDFYSFVLIELFFYIYCINKKDYSTFLEYLERRLECIMSQNNIEIKDIENQIEEIDEESNDMEIIKKSIDKINDIKSVLNTNPDLTLGLNMKSKCKKLLKKLFVIHKLKIYSNYMHTKSYIDLQEIINSITFDNDDLASPPSILSTIKNINTNNNDLLFQNLNNFIRDKLNNQFGELNSSIKIISENLYGRKIRVAFIGNISVGKSTVLNSIIGENILPTKESECTYRGIIIKYKDIDDFLLYRTQPKQIAKGAGYEEYEIFEEDNEPYCYGIENIKSYLKNKNSDYEIKEKDAFIVIQGRLKIFDFMKLDEELIKKIEFIDLPGHDRQNNVFNNKKFYEKVLKYSNSCIYINEAKTIDDEDSITRMKNQYNLDKSKLFSFLQPQFIYTCLFLINKSDTIPKKEDRNKIKNNLIKIIKTVEPNAPSNKLNISFFSGKYFFEYLQYSKLYVEQLEKNPLKTLNYLYNEWASDRWYFWNFKKYIVNKISDKIEEKFDLDLDEDNIKQIPSDFYKKLKNAFNQLYSKKHRGINSKEEDQVIKKLYSIYKEFKNKDFSNTNYSSLFFNKLKEVIIYSDNLQKENLKRNIDLFFRNADELFNRKINLDKTEIEKTRQRNQEKYDLFKNIIIPKANELLNTKESRVKNIIIEARDKCLQILDDEISNYEDRLSDCDNEIEKAGKKLEEKLKPIITEMQTKQENETKTIIDEIIALTEEIINKHYSVKGLSLSELEKEKDEALSMALSIISSVLTGLATATGIIVTASLAGGIATGAIISTIFTTLGGVLIGGLGILGGVIIGGAIWGIGYLIKRSKIRQQYKDALEKNNNDLKDKFEDILSSFINDFKGFKETLIKQLNVKVDVLYKNINQFEPSKWENLKKEYIVKKDNIKIKLDEKLKKY